MLTAIRAAKGESPVAALSRLILYPLAGQTVYVLGVGMYVWDGTMWQESDASVIAEVLNKDGRG